MKKKTSKALPTAPLPDQPLEQLAALWAMRILLDLRGWRNAKGNISDTALETIGLPHLDNSDMSAKQQLVTLRTRQNFLESSDIKIRGVFKRNLKTLGKLIGLSCSEIKILAFATVMDQHSGLDDAADTLSYLPPGRVMGVLAIILELPVQRVRQSLSGTALLVRSGLLHLSSEGNSYLHGRLELLSSLGNSLLNPSADALSMLRPYFGAAKYAELDHADFDHIHSDYRLITRYVQSAREKKLAGVNILIHGTPGTGKSQLARVLAQELELTLYEVNIESPDGDPLDGPERFSAYQLGQQVLARNEDAILLFDEVEDVFPATYSPLFGRVNTKEVKKAWINRLLEENPVPAIWISNAIDQIDNAFIRRFDYVLKLTPPPRKTRAKILRRHLEQLPVSDRWIDRVAENPHLAPAVITRAARVARLGNDGQTGSIEQNLERVLSNTLSAMGYSENVIETHDSQVPYCLDAINPDQDIRKLVSGLRRHPHGRLCLYGPPGTGKTEFGHFIAAELNKPLLIRRASDLLDPYVGMTEQHLAEMFEQATVDDAVLVLDEADSFLQDRTTAQRQWEITQVNELLTQMERFNGLFICSTNLMDSLDSASLRRFDFKIRFDYLKSSQAWLLFCDVLKSQQMPSTDEEVLRARLDAYENLTPGDFTTIVRQNRLIGEALTAEVLLEGLAGESDFKTTKTTRGIGFTAPF